MRQFGLSEIAEVVPDAVIDGNGAAIGLSSVFPVAAGEEHVVNLLWWVLDVESLLGELFKIFVWDTVNGLCLGVVHENWVVWA